MFHQKKIKTKEKNHNVYIGIELKEKLNEKIFLIFVKHFDHVILRIRIFGEEGMYLPFYFLFSSLRLQRHTRTHLLIIFFLDLKSHIKILIILIYPQRQRRVRRSGERKIFDIFSLILIYVLHILKSNI